MRWAVAGRNRQKLTEIAEQTGAHGVLVADSSNPPSIDRMAESTRVLLTTVGPYVKYGTPVFDACVVRRTHYVDINGEPHWVRDMMDRCLNDNTGAWELEANGTWRRRAPASPTDKRTVQGELMERATRMAQFQGGRPLP